MALNEPVPSKSFDVLEENMQNTDKFVNSTDEFFDNRPAPNGQARTRTLFGINKQAADAIRNAGGVPLDDGVWGAGKTYNAYNEYLVFNSVPYKPLVIPYQTQGADPTAAPDNVNVQPWQNLSIEQVGDLTNLQAANLGDMLSGNTVGGETITHKAGQVWQINGMWEVLSVSNPMTIDDFKPIGSVFVNDLVTNPGNCADAFRNALAKTESEVVGYGDFILREEVILPSGTRLNMQNARILAEDGIQGDYSHKGIFTVDGGSDIRMSGFRMSMYGENFTDGLGGERPKVSMILVKNGASDVHISKVYGDGGCNRSGTNFSVVGALVHFEGASDCTVRRCMYNGYFNTGSVHDAKVLGYKPYTEAYYIDGTSTNIDVKFNRSYNSNYSGFTVSASGDASLRGHNISFNIADGTDGTCLSLNSSGCTVVGNKLRNSYSNGGITISHTGQPANNNVITSNEIRDVWFNGIAYGDVSYNNNVYGNTIINANQSDTASSSEAGHSIRVRGRRNTCSNNVIKVKNNGDCAISVHSVDDQTKLNYALNSVQDNQVENGFISIRAPYSTVQGNKGWSGGVSAFIQVGFRSNNSVISGNNAYDITRCVSVSANVNDTNDYAGISVFDNHGGAADNPEVVNVPVNKQATLATNMRYVYPNSVVTDRQVAWEVKGETSDASITGTNKSTGSLKALCQNSSGTQYGWVTEASAVTGGELTTVEAFEVSPFNCEIRRLNGGQSELIMTNEVGVRYKLRITGSSVTVDPA